MNGTRTFELKVGVFILIGIAILFLIVFSIGDINLSKTGYKIKVLFGFAAGIGPSAPVRLAGVGVGQIHGIRIIRDEKAKTTKAEITAWINDGAKIEKDAVVTINTLGLLGEKYLEILENLKFQAEKMQEGLKENINEIKNKLLDKILKEKERIFEKNTAQ